MRITNKQFFNQYLAGHDGEAIHSLLSQVMFLLKKKSLHIFMQLPENALTSELQELRAMVQILKDSFKLNRQSLTVLLRLTEESYGLRQTMEVRAYKGLDQHALQDVIDAYSSADVSLSETNEL